MTQDFIANVAQIIVAVLVLFGGQKGYQFVVTKKNEKRYDNPGSERRVNLLTNGDKTFLENCFLRFEADICKTIRDESSKTRKAFHDEQRHR